MSTVPGAALAVEERGLQDKIQVVGTSLVSVSGPYLKSGAAKLISFWVRGGKALGAAEQLDVEQIVEGFASAVKASALSVPLRCFIGENKPLRPETREDGNAKEQRAQRPFRHHCGKWRDMALLEDRNIRWMPLRYAFSPADSTHIFDMIKVCVSAYDFQRVLSRQRRNPQVAIWNRLTFLFEIVADCCVPIRSFSITR
jgi:hypothetical protein